MSTKTQQVIQVEDLRIQPLFQQAMAVRGYEKMKLALEERLEELVKDKDHFFLTGVMLQEQRDLIGELLFGLHVDLDLHTFTDSWPVPDSIKDARVKMQSIEPVCEMENGKPKLDDNGNVIYTGQWRPSNRPIRFKRSTKISRKQRLIGNHGHNLKINNVGVVANRQDNVIERPAECEMSLQDAWTCLANQGMYVAPAIRVDHQARKWRVREVPPAGLSSK